MNFKITYFVFTTCFLMALSSISVVIEKGPFKGHDAQYNEDIKAWVIAGDTSKAPTHKPYNGVSVTSGISYRRDTKYQFDFKKIWLLQGAETQWNNAREDTTGLEVDDLNQLRTQKLDSVDLMAAIIHAKAAGKNYIDSSSLRLSEPFLISVRPQGSSSKTIVVEEFNHILNELYVLLEPCFNLDSENALLLSLIKEKISNNDFSDDVIGHVENYKNAFLDLIKAVVFIREKLGQGFGVIAGSLEKLQEGHKILPFARKLDDMIIFHPSVPKAAFYLWTMRSEDNPNGWDTFQEGLLLSYVDVDVFAWVYGTDFTQKIFPQIEFSTTTESSNFSAQDLNRVFIEHGAEKIKAMHLAPLKEKLADEYSLVVAEYNF